MGALQQFNPTKVFIDFFALFGQAYGRKRATKMWEDRKALWRKDGKVVKETISGPPLFRVKTVTIVDGPKAVAPETSEVAETHVKHD
jgi:hypothetical protein